MTEGLTSAPARDKPITTLERAFQGFMVGVALGRAAYGPEVEQIIINKAPEERTWPDMGKAMLVTASDTDGKLMRAIGLTSRLGALADELADKFLTNKGFQALKKTGEISAGQADIQFGRDVIVTGLRLADWYRHRGDSEDDSKPRATAVDSAAQNKTAFQFLTEVIAVSPLSQHNKLLREGSAISTGQSVTSGAAKLFRFVGELRKDRPEREETTTRNSPFREMFAHPIDTFVSWLDENHPRITADNLTDIGKFGVIAAGVLAYKYPDKPFLPTALFTLSSLIDATDGKKSDKERARTGEEPTIDGMLKDTLADRTQEIFILGVLSAIARRRGNDLAADNYAVAAMSAALPSLLRAEAEKQGLVVPEAAFGSRVWRAIISGAGIYFNGSEETSDTLSATLAVNTLTTAKDRRDIIKKGAGANEGVSDDERLKSFAEARHEALEPVTVRGAVIGAGLLAARKILSKPSLKPAATPSL